MWRINGHPDGCRLRLDRRAYHVARAYENHDWTQWLAAHMFGWHAQQYTWSFFCRSFGLWIVLTSAPRRLLSIAYVGFDRPIVVYAVVI